VIKTGCPHNKFNEVIYDTHTHTHTFEHTQNRHTHTRMNSSTHPMNAHSTGSTPSAPPPAAVWLCVWDTLPTKSKSRKRSCAVWAMRFRREDREGRRGESCLCVRWDIVCHACVCVCACACVCVYVVVRPSVKTRGQREA